MIRCNTDRPFDAEVGRSRRHPGRRGRRLKRWLFVAVLVLHLPVGPAAVHEQVHAGEPQPQPEHASGFELSYGDGYRVLTVLRPHPDAERPRRYLLLERGREVPEQYRDLPRVRIPVERAVTGAAPLLAQFEVLDAPDRVVGHDNTRRIYSETFRRRRDEGKLTTVGEPPQMNIERVVSLDPDVVLINALGPHNETEHKLREAGLPVMVLGDWLETDPLGRAEWLLVAGVLLQREKQAVKYLQEITSRYNGLAGKVREPLQAANRPKALLNAPFQGAWSVPGGDSYMARLLEDAGAEYPWAQSSGQGAIHLELESVLGRAADATVWLNPGTAESAADLLRLDPRLRAFRAFETGRVYNFTARTRPGGANDYFERGVLEPHHILADLIHIMHPELLPEHRLRYFRSLR